MRLYVKQNKSAFICLIALLFLVSCKKRNNPEFAKIITSEEDFIFQTIHGDEDSPIYRIAGLTLSNNFIFFTETTGNIIYSYELASGKVYKTGGLGKGPNEYIRISNIHARGESIEVIDLVTLLKRKYSNTLVLEKEEQSQYGINATQFYSTKDYDLFVGMFGTNNGLYAGLLVKDGDAKYLHNFEFRYPSFCYASTIDTVNNIVFGKYCFGKEIFRISLKDLNSNVLKPNDSFIDMDYDKIISSKRSETMTNYSKYLNSEKHSFTNGIRAYDNYLFYSNLIEDPIGKKKEYIIELFDLGKNASLKSIIIDDVLRYFIGVDSQFVYTAKFEKSEYGKIHLYKTRYSVDVD